MKFPQLGVVRHCLRALGPRAFAMLVVLPLWAACRDIVACPDGGVFHGKACQAAERAAAGASGVATANAGGSAGFAGSTAGEGVSVQSSGVGMEDAGVASMTSDSGAGGAPPAQSMDGPVCGDGVREGAELCDGADCSSECASDNACIVSRLVGAAKTCDAQCMTTEVVACLSGDGCCPSGCDHGADSDCSPSCGDGVLSDGETCEPSNSAYPCPSPATCDDYDPCTADKVTGNAQQCSARCAHEPIASAKSGDGCCPRGANIGEDDDCAAACGDGVVSSGEACDTGLPGSCPTRTICERMDRDCMRGRLVGSGCNAQCEEQAVTEPNDDDGCCPSGASLADDNDCAPSCGDGVVTWGNGVFEQCDPGIPAGRNGACPTTADCIELGRDRCQTGQPKGSGCDVECDLHDVGPVDGDRCCVPPATFMTDSDCKPRCGDGIFTQEDEYWESCDPAIPRGRMGACPVAADCAAMNNGCHVFELIVPGPSTANYECQVACVDRNPNCSR
jgi:hypothetical protein